IDDLDATIRDIRRSIFELQSHNAPAQSTRARVLEVAASFAKPLGFEPRVAFAGPVDALVTGEVADHLVAVVRELLSNVARHAGATQAAVDLAVGEDIVLRVV
ncbi:MAG: hypothetical protein C4321_11285, partial [Chloroflexota bacterium]